MSLSSPLRRYRVLVLGAGGVGKSAITRRYVHNDFQDVYDPTVEDCFFKNGYTKNGEEVELEIVDTAGYDQFVGFKEIQLKEADGIVIVLGVDSAESMLMAKLLLKEAMRSRDDSGPFPCIILANKSDLNVVEVSGTHLEALSREVKVRLVLTSARLNRGIDQAFQSLCTMLVTHNPSPAPRLQKKKSVPWWRKFGSRDGK